MAQGKVTVSVIGIGRVGLPMALFLAEKNFTVYGIGRTKSKIENLKKGHLPFFEEGLSELKRHINKSFFPTTDYGVIRKSQIIIMSLGTPIDENVNPVLDQINEALESMIPYLKKGQLIILRSTLSPTTTQYVKNVLSMKTKFKIGKDVLLAFCPERIAEGHSIKEIQDIPQIIGGINPASSAAAKKFFSSFGVQCLITDTESAELAKLFTNMYRYISFAIANEFMILAENHNRNIHEIINLVNSGYKRGGLALPGLTAGPCLFKDGFFLINDNPYLDLITASWKINETVPNFLIKKIKEKISLKNKRVVILGLAFKAEIDDTRESLSFKLRKTLLHENAEIVLHDTYVKHYTKQPITASLPEALKGADVVIIATKHNEYVEKKMEILKSVKKKTYICDIWNTFEANKLIFTADQIKISKRKN
jgi:UDP-N-acetyl-D-mannosaminuronic acid dehydrogenase